MRNMDIEIAGVVGKHAEHWNIFSQWKYEGKDC